MVAYFIKIADMLFRLRHDYPKKRMHYSMYPHMHRRRFRSGSHARLRHAQPDKHVMQEIAEQVHTLNAAIATMNCDTRRPISVPIFTNYKSIGCLLCVALNSGQSGVLSMQTHKTPCANNIKTQNRQNNKTQHMHFWRTH